MLTNKATVNEIPTDEVKTPVITFSKKAEQSTVKAGEKILYTITLVNSSEVTGKVIVKDEAPENTTFVDGSIELNKVQLKDKDNNVLTEQNLKDGIEVEVTANSEVTLTFEVTVNEQNSLNDGDIIKNTAYVNEKPSEETETEYKYADSTDKKIEQAYILVDKQNKKITQLTNQTTEHETKLTQQEQDINGIKTKVENTAEYKREKSGITEIHIEDAGQADILRLEVQGNKTYETNMFPRANLFPRAGLQPNQRGG